MMCIATVGYTIYAKINNHWPFIYALSEEIGKGNYASVEVVEEVTTGVSEHINLLGEINV